MRRANEAKLPEGSLGRAFLEFSQMPGIHEEHVLSEINLAFIAGHETTAHSLSWVIYALCKFPNIQTRVQQEIDAFDKSETKDGLLPDYIEAVVKESMRKYPVANGSFRMVTKEDGYDLDKYHLEQGDWIVINLFVVHNLERNWGPDVDEFKPERWLPASEAEPNPLSSPAVYAGGGQTPNSIAFLPFSVGVRNCLGMNMALLEMRLTLARLVKRYSFRFVDEKMADESYALERALFLSPKDKLPVYVLRRATARTK